ncbi:MAG: hypothetical protein DMG42_27765 [Acidobacteria bacterium]|nr:MAG: hypothetical protein AUH13_11185 [Acidobacteria bacterium 13_2_20CM_58_27]PYT67092.1 MAG: hypothetical protein DMG42_27765 [Acidobacteriota bacterium]
MRLTGAAVQLGLKRGKESHPPRDRPERKGCASKNQTRTVWLCLPKILCSPRWKDDAVLGFQHRDDAKRFLQELQERMGKFGLELVWSKN